MRRLILVCVFALVASTAHAQLIPNEWITEGIKVNPGASTVLAQYVNTTGGGETRTLHLIAASTIGTVVFIEHLAADGTTLVASGGSGGRAQALALNSLTTFEFMKQIVTLDIGERIRIRTGNALTGQIQCSLYLDN